jgi:phage gp36-like protein
MAFLVKTDLKTHLYSEILDEITRDDDTIIDNCISRSIQEVKSYLSRYDLLQMFGDSNTASVLTGDVLDHLKNLVKDVACWHLVKLANPNVNMELFKQVYDDTIKFLNLVAAGKADPEGWIYKADDPATNPYNENDFIQFTSNTKRTQHF